MNLLDVLVRYDDAKHEISVCRTNPDLSFKQWDYLTDHTLTISKDVKDLADNSFDGNGDGVGGDDYVATFRTEAAPDTVSPKVIADNMTSGFNVYGTLEFTVDEALDPAKINSTNIVLEKTNGVRVYGTASYNAATNKVTFQPNSRLDYATDHVFRALKNVTDLRGNLLDGNGDGTGGDDYVKNFRTQDKPSSSPVARMNASPSQGFAPLVETVSDAGSTDAEDAPSSLQGNASWGDGASTGWKSLDQLVNQQHTYNSAGSFTITYQVRDTDGKIGTATKTVNVVQQDTEPPYVNLTNISNNFSVNSDITFTFNEPVQESSIVVSLKKGATNVSFSQSYNGSSKTLTVHATSPFTFSTNYTATVNAQDLSGNRLDGDRNGTGGDAFSGDLTTQSAPNDPPNSNFELDKTSGTAPVTVNLDASSSTDDQDPASNLQKKISWGDGTTTGWQSSSTAAHTFNNPGNYTITLYVKDTGGLEDGTPKTATVAVAQPILEYRLRGNVSALIEGGSLSGVTVRAGGKSATTDGGGSYEIQLPPGTYTVTAEKTSFYTRTLDNVVVGNDRDLSMDMISGNLDMNTFNQVCRSFGKTQRITGGKTIYFNTKKLNDGQPVPESWKSSMRSAISALGSFCPYGMNIVEGTTPPFGQSGYFIVSWDPRQNSNHYERLSGDEIDYAEIVIGSGGELHEIAQSTGARGDGGNGVFAGGGGFTQQDLMMGKVLFSRNPGNRSPDRN
ncbi:MAG: Ig-like domain-containing protein [bacterium]|nr:Ig-like domain-containing protein [bacterium]